MAQTHTTNHRIALNSRPVGAPTPDNFRLETADIPALAPGQVLRLIADDPAAVIDVPHFCAEQGHVLLAEEALQDGTPARPPRAWLIRRKA